MSNYTSFPQASSGNQQKQQAPYLQANGSFFGFPQASSSSSGFAFPQASQNAFGPFAGSSQQSPPAAMSPQALTMSPQAMTMSPQAMMLSNRPAHANPISPPQLLYQPVASTSKQVINDSKPATVKPAVGPKPIPPATNALKPTLNATAHLASPSASTEHAMWNRAHNELKGFLNKDRIRKSPLTTGEQIVKILSAFDGGKDVPIAGRREVLAALVVQPPLPSDFFRVLIGDKEQEGIKLLENWLLEAFRAHKGKNNDKKADEALRLTLSSVLRVLHLLPVTVDHLKGRKIGPVIAQIQADSKSKPAEQKFNKSAHDLANQLRAKWTAMASKAPPESAPAEAKKRPDPPTEDPARKKAKVEIKTKVESKPKAESSKVAGKAKAAVAAASPADAATPGLSFLSPSTMPAISALSIGRKRSAVAAAAVAAPAPKKESTPPPLSAISPATATAPPKSGFAEALRGIRPKDISSNLAGPTKRNKKRKSVHWPKDDSELVAIKEIEAREEGVSQEHLDAEAARQLDANEGARFKRQRVEDTDGAEGLETIEPLIDWQSPADIVLPPARDGEQAVVYPDPQSLGSFPIAEAEIQHEREATTPSTFYADASDVPLTAKEPPVAFEAVAAPTEIPLPGKFLALESVQAALQFMASNDYSTPSGNPADYAVSNAQFAELLGALRNVTSSAPAALPAPASAVDSSALALLQTADLSAFANALPQPTLASTGAVPFGAVSAWNTQTDSQAGPIRNTTDWNRLMTGTNPEETKPNRRRKPYMGRKRIPCKFFALGRCDEGDNCSFVHDAP